MVFVQGRIRSSVAPKLPLSPPGSIRAEGRAGTSPTWPNGNGPGSCHLVGKYLKKWVATGDTILQCLALQTICLALPTIVHAPSGIVDKNLNVCTEGHGVKRTFWSLSIPLLFLHPLIFLIVTGSGVLVGMIAWPLWCSKGHITSLPLSQEWTRPDFYTPFFHSWKSHSPHPS